MTRKSQFLHHFYLQTYKIRASLELDDGGACVDRMDVWKLRPSAIWQLSTAIFRLSLLRNFA